MAFSVAEIVTTIPDLALGNNPDRVGDVTAEPFNALPRDSEKRPNAVAANFAMSFSIDAARGRCRGCRLRLNLLTRPKKLRGIFGLSIENPQG